VAAVRALIPRYEAKIQRVLARVWGTGAASLRKDFDGPMFGVK
jgi:hypothetical protein